MAEIKGALLNAWMKFLKDRFGEKAVAGAHTALSPGDHQLLSTLFLDSSWYPYDTLHALRRLTRSLASSSGPELAVEIGRAMAHHVFTGVYRSLLTNDPIKQLETFSEIATFFFRETRRLETQLVSNSSCLVRYHYEKGATPTRAICASLAGFWSRTLEMAGASRVKAAHPKCVASGGDCCEFTFAWEPRSGA